MAEPSPLTERELRFLRALTAHGVPFLIVGLSAAALQGAPVVTQDIDLWFERLDDPKLATALRQVGGAYVPPTPRGNTVTIYRRSSDGSLGEVQSLPEEANAITTPLLPGFSLALDKCFRP